MISKIEIENLIAEEDLKWGADLSRSNSKIEIHELSMYYGSFKVLENIQMSIPCRSIVALIGPSGCGKSSLLRCINRMNELIPNSRIEGEVVLDGENIYDPAFDVIELRRMVGMVFQKPNPFPKSVYDNVTFGPQIMGIDNKGELDLIVEDSLRRAALWDEVKDKLKASALSLSGGQQQRLCIARALALQPEVILLDEPCSALDPVATQKIEDLLNELKKNYTIVIVTHNMQQAARISDITAFLLMEVQGEPARLIECGDTKKIFTNPGDYRTERYITGRFG